MGYDITFHPIKREELQFYILDVIDKPALANKRAASLTADPEKRKMVTALYKELTALKAEVLAGDESFGRYPMMIASIAGLLHPYWYTRGSCLTFAVENERKDKTPGKEYLFRGLFESYVSVAPGTFKGMKDRSNGLIDGNWSASGFIDNKKLPRLRDQLNKGIAAAKAEREAKGYPPRRYLDPEPLDKIFHEEGLDALNHAIDYALAHGTGLMEANDVVVPFTNSVQSDGDNLRAEFLKNDDDPGTDIERENQRPGGLTGVIRRILGRK